MTLKKQSCWNSVYLALRTSCNILQSFPFSCSEENASQDETGKDIEMISSEEEGFTTDMLIDFDKLTYKTLSSNLG